MTESENSGATNADSELQQLPSLSPIYPQTQSISVKLSETNYLVWRQQIIATVRGYGLEAFLTGNQDVPPRMVTKEGATAASLNPEFVQWQRQDQLLVSWIQSSLTESTMVMIVGLNSVQEIWEALESSYSNQSRAKIMQHKLQLQTIKKDSLTMRDYLSKVKALCDLLGAAGCRISDDDQILHILGGLGTEYNPVMVAITSKDDSWTVQEVGALLMSFESRLEVAKPSSINTDRSQPAAHLAQASGQRRDPHNSTRSGQLDYHGGDSMRGGFRGGRGGRGGFKGRSAGNRVICQLCQKPSHTADKCWHRFKHHFAPQAPHPQPNLPNFHQQQHPTANVAQTRTVYAPSEYGDESIASTWYPDSGATNHISNDFSNLNTSVEYSGGNFLQLGDGHGLDIAHVGQSILKSSSSNSPNSFILNNLLHVPKVTKNLISVSHFARDNNVFFEFHPSYCLVKDQISKAILLKGQLDNGLYKFILQKPISKSSESSSPPKNNIAHAACSLA